MVHRLHRRLLKLQRQVERSRASTLELGSLGCKDFEAVEAAATIDGYKYVLGSVLNHASTPECNREEAMTAMKKYGIKPDVLSDALLAAAATQVVSCHHSWAKSLGEADYRFIAAEPASRPSLTRGRYAYDFCDTGHVCPMAKMYTIGSGYIPAPNHAGDCATTV